MINDEKIKQLAFEYANIDEGIPDSIMCLPEDDKQKVWDYYKTHYCIKYIPNSRGN